MADWPSPRQVYHSAEVHSSLGMTSSVGWIVNCGGYTAASAVYNSASRVFHIPFMIDVRTTINGAWLYNGTVVSGNVNIGLYDFATRTLLASTGSTAQAGTSAIQRIAMSAAYSAMPGAYIMSLVIDNVTATVFRITPSNASLRASGVAIETVSGVTLPTTAGTTGTSQAYVPVFGVSRPTMH